VISAVEGVQAHTETLWQALHALKIPVIIFVNKIDRVGADTEQVIKSIVKELGIEPLCLQETHEEGGNDVNIAGLWEAGVMSETLIEYVAETDDALLDRFLNGEALSFDDLDLQLAMLIRACKTYPLMLGSAKTGLGMQEMLDAVIKYFPHPAGDVEEPLSALVYGISHDRIMGKTAHVRLFAGRISNRDMVFNATRMVSEKVTRVRRVLPGRYEDTGVVEAGDVAGISGLSSVQVGDVLGKSHKYIQEGIKMRIPLLTVQVRANNTSDYAALAEAMLELAAEDPALELAWLRDEAELHVKVMGWIQMEVMERILADRFGISARFENPTVIYKETPAGQAEGFVRYWMPKPCWAIMKFLIEPGPRGSGVVYRSNVPVNDIQQKYQNEVSRSIEGALKQGIKGWEVTDICITLTEGEDHPMHSRAGDFAVATPMGIMDGLVKTGTTLLEPLTRFRITVTEDLLGAITSDITRMRGSFESPSMENGRFTICGVVPLATSLDFPVRLSSRSGGKARISTHFFGYGECTDDQGVIRPYKGVSPLDTAKYILKARKALQ
jgi:ribosomal protection tetracycline resistance protein